MDGHRAGLLSTAALLAALVPPGSVRAEPAPARKVEILYLLKQDCGSCHGLTLHGGLGPPLTPQALAGKPAGMLSAVILNGRPDTPMGPWSPFLTTEETQWLAQVLLDGEMTSADH